MRGCIIREWMGHQSNQIIQPAGILPIRKSDKPFSLCYFPIRCWRLSCWMVFRIFLFLFTPFPID